jgi:hypothetical protein
MTGLEAMLLVIAGTIISLLGRDISGRAPPGMTRESPKGVIFGRPPTRNIVPAPRHHARRRGTMSSDPDDDLASESCTRGRDHS